jgi:alpha-tubulin suppressor-like RCC1 family protein
MRYGPAGIALALALAACSLNVDYTGTLYKCGLNGACADGYVCLAQRCVPSEPGPAECAVAMTAGADHTCAVRSDGTAWCWGRDDYGQLGDGALVDRTTPVRVAGLTHVKAIAGGNNHSCAIDSDGKVWCWGRNEQGQLGNAGSSDSAKPAYRLTLSEVRNGSATPKVTGCRWSAGSGAFRIQGPCGGVVQAYQPSL